MPFFKWIKILVICATTCNFRNNKAKAVSAELLELNLKNKLEETG